uniref:Uncharacterized protein n=1 Tax=Triticum urartu TaxID=4572 RepID=A0A8R7QBI7_TRIUA
MVPTENFWNLSRRNLLRYARISFFPLLLAIPRSKDPVS